MNARVELSDPNQKLKSSIIQYLLVELKCVDFEYSDYYNVMFILFIICSNFLVRL